MVAADNNPVAATGEEDDDWFFTFFQPYRDQPRPGLPLHRQPRRGRIGKFDDRAQVEDNFYLVERLSGEEAAGRASFQPGRSYSVSPDGRRLLVVKRAERDARNRIQIVTTESMKRMRRSHAPFVSRPAT